MNSVIVALPRAALDTPSVGKLKSSKFDSFVSQGERLGLSFTFVLHPGEHLFGKRTEYSFRQLPREPLFWFYSLISFVTRVLGMARIREAALRAKTQSLSAAWAELFESISPRIVIGIGLPQELIELCAGREIPSIEIQHGLFDRFGIRKYWPLYKPSHMFCWDEFSASEVSSFGIEARVVGHPIIASGKLSRRSDIPDANLLNSHTKAFCVALSYGEPGGEGPSKNLYSSVILEIDRLVDLGYVPVFRIHPITAQSRRENLMVRRWTKSRWPESLTHDPRVWSMVDTIQNVEFLLTHSSSTAFEFSIFGKPSVVLDVATAERFMKSIDYLDPNERIIFTSVSEFISAPKVVYKSRHTEFTGASQLLDVIRGSVDQPSRT